MVRPFLERPPLGSPAQESYEPLVVDPDKGHKNYQGTGKPLLRRKSERLGVIQLGEEKVHGRSYCDLSLSVLKERWREIFFQSL